MAQWLLSIMGVILPQSSYAVAPDYLILTIIPTAP